MVRPLSDHAQHGLLRVCIIDRSLHPKMFVDCLRDYSMDQRGATVWTSVHMTDGGQSNRSLLNLHH
jgi:hypothetical protein